LVSRYYLESGKFKTRPGFAKVKSLITMGTPHRGAPMALSAALGREKRLFLNAEQVQTIASDPNFPSLYQLMPPLNEPFVCDRSVDARLLPIDIYEQKTAQLLGLSEANLNAAKEFHSHLDLARRPDHVRYFFFSGSRQPTAMSLQLVKRNKDFDVSMITREDAGDGTVPFWSSCCPGVQMEAVGGAHGDIYQNGILKSVLGSLLGRPGVLVAAGPEPEIYVQYKVVTPGSQVHVTLELPVATTSIVGELKVRRRVDSKGNEVQSVWKTISAVNYAGPQIDHLTVLIDAPDLVGIYEVAFSSTAPVVSEVSTEIFVQDDTAPAVP